MFIEGRFHILVLGGGTIAKDGTYIGGRIVKAGVKGQPAAEKIEKGKKVEILINDIPTFTPEEIDAAELPDGTVLDGTDMPTPSDYLPAKQKNGIPLGADEIYKETWSWLKQKNCEDNITI
ncbi:Uncharacterised protein [Anaerococcus vaginalis]|uniref:Uncharacterized protein n=1 Tax=Anaerococcus vaginalis TaxID=33037 RepID=A0A6N2SCB7_9FIRM